MYKDYIEFDLLNKEIKLSVTLKEKRTQNIKENHPHPFEFALNAFTACIECAVSVFLEKSNESIKDEFKNAKTFKDNEEIISNAIIASVKYSLGLTLDRQIEELGANDEK